MVTSTENPRLWRVEFTIHTSDLSKSLIVCFVHLRDAGLRVFYHCHVMFERSVPKGPWTKSSQPIRQELTPALVSMIQSALVNEVLSLAQIEGVSVYPADVDFLVTGAEEGVEFG